MKNLKIMTLLTLALANLLLVLPSTASASAQLPSGSFSIAFNGFCDGMDLTRTGPVSLAGTLSGCYLGDGIAAGTIAFNYQIVPFVSTPWVGAVVTSNNDQTDQSCILIYELNFTTQRWADYLTCSPDVPLSKLNSGTFRFGQPSGTAADTSLRPSGKR